MELVEALSNFEIQGRLRRLSEKLIKIAASGAKPHPSAFQHKRKAGAVASAIEKALGEADEPMRMKDIHTEVERELGQLVPRSTIKNCLANNCQGATGRFVRLERGRYRRM